MLVTPSMQTAYVCLPVSSEAPLTPVLKLCQLATEPRVSFRLLLWHPFSHTGFRPRIRDSKINENPTVYTLRPRPGPGPLDLTLLNQITC